MLFSRKHFNEEFFALLGDAPQDNMWPVEEEPTVVRQKELGWVNGMRWIPRFFPKGKMDYLGVLTALEKMVADKADPLKYFDVDFWFPAPSFQGIGKQEGLTDADYIARVFDLARDINGKLGKRSLVLHVAGELDSSSQWPFMFRTRKEAADYWKKWNGDLYRKAYAGSGSRQWTDSYENATPDLFSFYENSGRDIRQDPIYACCSRAWAVHQYYEWGFGSVTCEGNCYTPWNTQLQIAFLRGAARQYDGYWGMDYSPWGSVLGIQEGGITRGTTYSSHGYSSGISASLLLREWLTAFMSGAHLVMQESSYHTHFIHDYSGKEKNGVGDFPDTEADGKNARAEYVKKISPVGENAGRFADFALRKGKERGKPYVPFGFVMEHDHGWNSLAARKSADKEGNMLVPDSWPPVVWAGTIKDEPGDYMITNFFRAAFSAWPNFYWTPGRMAKRMLSHRKYYGTYWDKSDEEVFTALKNNTLPIERLEQDVYIGASRWGDSFDVVLENCSLEVLKDFRILVLLGRVKLTGNLLERLALYVAQGGTLVANILQLDADGKKWLGIKSTGSASNADQSRDMISGTVFIERRFTFTPCTIEEAEVIAETNTKEGLIYRIPRGNGEVFLAVAHYLQADDALASEEEGMESRLLKIGMHLIDRLHEKTRLVAIEGSSIQRIVTRTGTSVKITLINNYQTNWSGSLSWKENSSPLIVQHKAHDCWQDTELAVDNSRDIYTVSLQIEPYSIRVIEIK